MTDPQITEYSAIALLFLLVILGGRIAWKWVEGYNTRATERQAAELSASRDREEERKRANSAMAELIAADIEAKKDLGTAMQSLVKEIQDNNGAVAEAIRQVCESMKELSLEHRRSHILAEKKAERRHKELVP